MHQTLGLDTASADGVDHGGETVDHDEECGFCEHRDSDQPFAKTQPLRFGELTRARRSTEVLVKIGAAGFARHSDLSAVKKTEWPILMVLGHEASGVIHEVGRTSLILWLAIRVTITFVPRCEECDPCQTGGRLPCVNAGLPPIMPASLLSGAIRFHDGDEEIHRTHWCLRAFSE